LPSPDKLTEGAVYVVPEKPGNTKAEQDFFNGLVQNAKLRPGDVFTVNNVDHANQKFNVDPVPDLKSAYATAIRAPALVYGNR
jgi:hypothetical protein